METDLNDYTVIKEGEAEILMHKKNQVFFNKAQVNNRDMSIAVLREFLSKRKQEHEAKSSKRTRPASKVIEKDASEASKEETPSENGMNNGDHEVASEDGPSSVSKDPAKTTERFAPREPKPPKVLEVFLYFFFGVLLHTAYCDLAVR
jgi:tRNA (guanine26-N2/guanine27-N2)-dimethyltransferase